MKFSELIDKESMLLDRKRLAEWRNKSGKQEMILKIDEIKHKFIEENCVEWEVMVLLCKFTEEIKNIL